MPSKSGPESPRRAIVIGAGHNGLACAFYLAKAGRATRVLERRHLVGGCAVTDDIDPFNPLGCRVSTASNMARSFPSAAVRVT